MRQIVASQTGTGQTDPLPLDIHGMPETYVQVVVSGTVTYSVQQTLDNPFEGGTLNWFDHPDTDLVGASTNQQGVYASVPAAVRLNVTAGSGTATITIVQAGAGQA